MLETLEFDRVDGRFKENLVISYFKNVQHAREGLHIPYDDPDTSLRSQDEISLDRQCKY